MGSQKRYILLSGIIHAALVGIIAIQDKKTEDKSEKIEVIFQEATQESNSTIKIVGKGKVSKSSKTGSLQTYLPGYRFDKGMSFSNDRDSYLSNPRKDDVASPWGSGAGTFERIAEFNLYQELYRNVDGYLSYPGVLARNKIMGTVNARLVLEDKGSCDWKKTKIQGHNAYLELYVLDLLKKVCLSNYKRFTRDRLLTNIDLSFQFDISENNDLEVIEKKKFIVGNTLMFYRNSHRSITEWELGPFKGVFPVPTVYLNLPWIQENWDRLVNNKDPMQEFKKRFGET